MLCADVTPVIVDTDAKTSVARPDWPEEEYVYHALALGLRDYLHKCGFKSAVLGLSGGIDSALVAVLAVAALGKENVRGVSLPSQFSSQGSLDDARALADWRVDAIVLPHHKSHEVKRLVDTGAWARLERGHVLFIALRVRGRYRLTER